MYGGGYAGDPRGREAAVEARQGRDDFSFEDKKADAQIGGYYSFERDVGQVWNPGPNPFKKASPEESFSAKPIAQPIAKPAAPKIGFYLDESPAFVEQQVASVAPVARVTNEPTGEIKHQIDTFSDFTPAPYSGALTALTDMTPEGWNLHRKASESIKNDPNLTAAQKDAAKAKNIVTLGKMNPFVAAAGAYPYQVLQEVYRNPISGWKTGGLAALANLKGIGSALAEEDYFGKENSLTQGFTGNKNFGSLFNLGGSLANTQAGLMRMYDLLLGQGNSAPVGGGS